MPKSKVEQPIKISSLGFNHCHQSAIALAEVFLNWAFRLILPWILSPCCNSKIFIVTKKDACVVPLDFICSTFRLKFGL